MGPHREGEKISDPGGAWTHDLRNRGADFFLPFMAQAQTRKEITCRTDLAQTRKEITCRTDLANEANKMFII